MNNAQTSWLVALMLGVTLTALAPEAVSQNRAKVGDLVELVTGLGPTLAEIVDGPGRFGLRRDLASDRENRFRSIHRSCAWCRVRARPMRRSPSASRCDGSTAVSRKRAASSRSTATGARSRRQAPLRSVGSNARRCALRPKPRHPPSLRPPPRAKGVARQAPRELGERRWDRQVGSSGGQQVLHLLWSDYRRLHLQTDGEWCNGHVRRGRVGAQRQ